MVQEKDLKKCHVCQVISTIFYHESKSKVTTCHLSYFPVPYFHKYWATYPSSISILLQVELCTSLSQEL